MFDDKEGMRIAAGKSALRKKLQVVISTRFVPEADITIIDGCAVICILSLARTWNSLRLCEQCNPFTYIHESDKKRP